ncbi:MAG: thiamine phosphate synthase [Gemmatimonadales bacterium]|nr:thiamine phosphate synthase [Gemmatimonadales bacterium]
MAPNVASLVRLMLVTDDRLVGGRDLLALARAAEAGGATSVQLRLKDATTREQVALARALVAALGIPVLVNDRPDVALAAGAAGVHLGPEDLSVSLARTIAPPGFVIGASVGSAAEAATARSADYWGVGPWRLTSTKADAGAGLGADGFARLASLAGGRPCLAIGGVRADDVVEVFASGGAGVAVVSGILGSTDVQSSTASYSAALTLAIPP